MAGWILMLHRLMQAGYVLWFLYIVACCMHAGTVSLTDVAYASVGVVGVAAWERDRRLTPEQREQR
jgi:hypothetical protein